MKEALTKENKATMYQQLDDIDEHVNWGALAREYFDKSASWFYHKLDGRDGNGKPTEFSYEERVRLKGALCDIASRIRCAADTIEV